MPETAGLTELLTNQTDLIFNNSPAIGGYVSTYAHVYGIEVIAGLLVVNTILLGLIAYNTLNRSENL